MATKDNKILRNKWFYAIELMLDVIIITLSYYLGFKLQRAELFADKIPNDLIIILLYIAVISLIFILLFKINRCGQKALSTTIFNILLILPLIALSSVFIDFILKGIGIWRRTIFYAFCFQIPTLIILKFIIFKIHNRLIKLRHCIVVGANLEDAALFALKLIDDKNNIYEVKHLAQQNSPQLYDCINNSMYVFICSSCEQNIKTQLIEYCVTNNIDCAIIPNINDIVLNSGYFNNINDIMLLGIDIKQDIESRIIKRIIDIIISVISLIILLPLILIIVILIKLQDGGKVIYSQKRITIHNKPFTIYKFRTMIEGAEKKTGAVLASINDKRITKLGKFLRASRMDEIPQLFNVLKGEMSIVGPRPERPDLIDDIIKTVPEFKYRTLVKAGLTGLAQTMGKYNTTFSDKLLFDLYYANNYSFILDLKIMFYTLHTLIRPSVTNGLSDEKYDINALDILKSKGYKIVENDGCADILLGDN